MKKYVVILMAATLLVVLMSLSVSASHWITTDPDALRALGYKAGVIDEAIKYNKYAKDITQQILDLQKNIGRGLVSQSFGRSLINRILDESWKETRKIQALLEESTPVIIGRGGVVEPPPPPRTTTTPPASPRIAPPPPTCQPFVCQFRSCTINNPRASCWKQFYGQVNCQGGVVFQLGTEADACTLSQNTRCITWKRNIGHHTTSRSEKWKCPEDSCIVGGLESRYSCPSGRFVRDRCVSRCPSCVGNAGSSCNVNACGQGGGTIQCDGSCSGAAKSMPAKFGQSCGNCGIIGCSGTCEGQGVCHPGTSQCIGPKYQTCSSSCALKNLGLGDDFDGDGVDSQCGDSLCDNVREVTDATRKSSEQGFCNDNIDNDCDGKIDLEDQPDCCTIITRDCKQYTKKEFDTIHNKKGTPPGHRNKQIKDNNHFACSVASADTACCTDADSCVFDGVCYPDKFKGDVDGDGIREVCIASSPGKWIEEFETICDDSVDNDLDGLPDCQDPDCAGSISGRVKDTDNKNIDNAKIDIIQFTTLKNTTSTLPSGKYDVKDVLCGTYNMVASEPDYVPSTKTDIVLAPLESKTVDFIGSDALVLGTTCEDDCTYAGDNTIHKECDQINGCAFFDPIAAEACNLAQPGWIRAYDSTQSIECAEGRPQTNIETKAIVTCEGEENLIKLTKVVTYKGKLAKLVVVTCG